MISVIPEVFNELIDKGEAKGHIGKQIDGVFILQLIVFFGKLSIRLDDVFD